MATDFQRYGCLRGEVDFPKPQINDATLVDLAGGRHGSNHRACRNDAVLRNDHDAVTHEVARSVEALDVVLVANDDVVADPRILVDNGALDGAARPDADGNDLTGGVVILLRLVEVGAHHHGVSQAHAVADDAANTDDRMFDLRFVDAAAFAYDGFIERDAAPLRAGQVLRPGVNPGSLREELDWRS